MTKRLHPIRKMRQDYDVSESVEQGERKLARHVKPLLDALDQEHEFCRDVGEEKDCSGCALLAAWRAKL